MKIDLDAVFKGQVSYAEAVREISHADLYQMTDELFDELESILANATDGAVHFVPSDPAASDQSEQGWTLSHIVTHVTSTLDEVAGTSAMLARGIQVTERLRYETPWEELSTLPMVLARLQESRRMCRAFLDAWPDVPQLNVTRTVVPALGPMDAVGIYVLGIVHGQAHLDQVRETLRQFSLSADR